MLFFELLLIILILLVSSKLLFFLFVFEIGFELFLFSFNLKGDLELNKLSLLF